MSTPQLTTPLDLPRRVETPDGCAEWRHLPWDSEQFGFRAARLDRLEAAGSYADARVTLRDLLRTVLAECGMEGVRHLVSRVAIEQLSAIHALSDLGFELIDGIQTYSRPIEGNEPIAADTRLFDAGDLDSVLEIARSSFVHDRFHCDSSLSEQVADRVNETWTRNCCLGRAADAVVIAEVESRPASYVACRVDPKNQLGTIILVATALWARGHGAAARATRGALHWFAAQDIRLVEVGTQLKNIPAARLYEGCGFRLSGVSLTFRKLI